MSNKSMKPFMLATGALLLGGLAVSQSAFAVKQLGSGYQVTTPDGTKAAEGKCGEGKCGAEMKKDAGTKAAEGKCGEGKCGAEMKKDAGTKAAEGKCGEGKCGEGKCGMSMADTNKDGKISKEEADKQHEAMFTQMDTNKDGFIDKTEMGKMRNGMCGEGKCGANKTKPMEGKCGGVK